MTEMWFRDPEMSDLFDFRVATVETHFVSLFNFFLLHFIASNIDREKLPLRDFLGIFEPDIYKILTYCV